MQRVPKKPTSTSKVNKWDGGRRIQTEANDSSDQFDINSLMRKYKRNLGQDYQAYSNTQQNMNSLNKRTGGGGTSFGNSNYNNRKSNGHSIDNNRLKKNSTSSQLQGNKNTLTRNFNYNRSLVQNNENSYNKYTLNHSNLNQSNNNRVSNGNNNYNQNGLQQNLSSINYNNYSNNNHHHNNHNNTQSQQQSQLQDYYKQSSTMNNKSQQYGNSAQNLQQQIQQSRLQQSKQSQQAQQQQSTATRLATEPAQSTQQQQQQIDPSKYTYENENKVVGSGTFGVVYKSKIKETGQVVAIKKVLQDKRYKNRELQILKELNHPNVLKMIHAFYSQGDNPDETYLHVVMNYYPETIYSMNRHYIKQRQYMPSILVKLYAYQIMRSLVYIHTQGICHRDIKPHNILVDPASNRVVLCDFGSAKKLIPGEPNISYICSRCYRAPELIFGAIDYTNQIDMWSTGCVIAEMINGEPLFIGESAIDQLVEIIKVLGTPSKEQVLQMNQAYDLKDYKFPQLKQREWKKVLRSKTDPLCVDFISKVLVYSPVERLNPLQAIAHPYFDELRDERKLKTLSTKIRIPNLFDFTKSELEMQPELTDKVIPPWYMEKYGIKSHH